MLASVNRKANQRVALVVQVGQSRYVLLICKIRGIYKQSRFQSMELIEVIRREATSSRPLESTVVLRRNDFQSSTKLDALIRNLRKHDLIPRITMTHETLKGD